MLKPSHFSVPAIVPLSVEAASMVKVPPAPAGVNVTFPDPSAYRQQD